MQAKFEVKILEISWTKLSKTLGISSLATKLAIEIVFWVLGMVYRPPQDFKYAYKHNFTAQCGKAWLRRECLFWTCVLAFCTVWHILNAGIPFTGEFRSEHGREVVFDIFSSNIRTPKDGLTYVLTPNPKQLNLCFSSFWQSQISEIKNAIHV
jgi:hypothetical protein